MLDRNYLSYLYGGETAETATGIGYSLRVHVLLNGTKYAQRQSCWSSSKQILS